VNAVVSAATRTKEPAALKPHWPEGVEQNTFYEVQCDDKGRRGGSWLKVLIAGDGDVHVSMQDWEEIPDGQPTPFPSIRVRSSAGGGRNYRTRQALLWLADAIRRDQEEQSS
jgi:hypothetical protein